MLIENFLRQERHFVEGNAILGEALNREFKVRLSIGHESSAVIKR